MTTITDATPRARKSHQCFHCGYDIPKGTRYSYRTGVDGDGWWTTHAHLACERYAVEEGLYDYNDGINEGYVREHVLGGWPSEHWVRFYGDGEPGGRWPAFRVGYAVALAARFTLLGSEGR